MISLRSSAIRSEGHQWVPMEETALPAGMHVPCLTPRLVQESRPKVGMHQCLLPHTAAGETSRFVRQDLARFLSCCRGCDTSTASSIKCYNGRTAVAGMARSAALK
jgi:hypothetical protein